MKEIIELTNKKDLCITLKQLKSIKGESTDTYKLVPRDCVNQVLVEPNNYCSLKLKSGITLEKGKYLKQADAIVSDIIYNTSIGYVIVFEKPIVVDEFLEKVLTDNIEEKVGEK